MSWSFSLYLYLSLPLYFSLSTVCPSLVAAGSNDMSIINYVCLCVCLFTCICPCFCNCLCLWFVHPWSLVEAMVCLESITARTSLSNWLVIDGSIPPATPYTILVFIIVIVLFIIVLHGSILLAPCTELKPSTLTKYW